MFSNKSLLHDTGNDHPENKYRINSILENLKRKKNLNLDFIQVNKFDHKYLQMTHDKDYLSKVEESFPQKGQIFLDGDTVLSPGSRDAAYDAVSSIINAIDLKNLKNNSSKVFSKMHVRFIFAVFGNFWPFLDRFRDVFGRFGWFWMLDLTPETNYSLN